MFETSRSGSSLVALLLKRASEKKFTQPAAYVEVSPTTKPSAPVEADPFGGVEMAPTNRRTIEVIRNGVKSTQTFEIPKKAGLPDWSVDVRDAGDVK